MKKERIVGIIPARYGSARFPGKPLVEILGKTLIQRTYENAKLCKELDALAIATDDERIFDHVQAFGGIAVMTPKECPTGTDRLAHVIKFHPHFFQSDIVVNIQGDEPCLDPKTVSEIVQILKEDAHAVMSTAASPLHQKEEAMNPSIVKVVVNLKNEAIYFSRALIPSGKALTFREDVAYLRHIGIYAFRRDFLLKLSDLPSTPLQNAEDLEMLKVLEHGYSIKVAYVKETHAGVDEPEDIQKIEKLICSQNTSSSPVEFVLR